LKTTFRTDSTHENIYAVVGSQEITERIQQAIARGGACRVEAYGTFPHPDYPNSNDWNLSIFEVDHELVAHTKDATTWRSQDPDAFASMLETYGAEGEYTHPTSPDGDVGYVLVRRLGKDEHWLSFSPRGRALIDRPVEKLDGDRHGAQGKIYTSLP